MYHKLWPSGIYPRNARMFLFEIRKLTNVIHHIYRTKETKNMVILLDSEKVVNKIQ